jgi:hypothetical protein
MGGVEPEEPDGCEDEAGKATRQTGLRGERTPRVGEISPDEADLPVVQVETDEAKVIIRRCNYRSGMSLRDLPNLATHRDSPACPWYLCQSSLIRCSLKSQSY